ncbi:MAG: 2-oxoacid:acceptor oxidoreductase family protein [Thermodesulfobacteriota bacterium]
MRNKPIELVIAGVGGQGVLFVTGLLAESAMKAGYDVLASETHGMAQRGGTVLSHLRVGEVKSPLVREGTADVVLVLRQEVLSTVLPFLRPGGMAVVNARQPIRPEGRGLVACIDAEPIAAAIGDFKIVNLIVLGFFLQQLERHPEQLASPVWLLPPVRDMLFAKRLKASGIEAFDRGYHYLTS